MIIANWNIRGMQQAPKKNVVRSIIDKFKIDLIGLLETKFTASTFNKFSPTFLHDWDFAHNFDIVNNGRILFYWNPKTVDVRIISVETQVIHAYVTCRVSGIGFHYALCYGFYSTEHRMDLWDSLILNVPLDSPALVCGDFNCVQDPSERVGKLIPSESEITDFVYTSAYLTLQDAPSTGCFFTWAGKDVVSKIDRTMINAAWTENNLFCRTDFLPRGIISDHSACVSTLFQQVQTFKRDFRFCNDWNQHPSFRNTLKEHWKVNPPGMGAQERLASKLRTLQPTLRQLNKSHYSNISERATAARAQLEETQRRCDRDPLNRELKESELQARKLCQQLDTSERNFLAQRAKAKHITLSDKSTKYFHSLVKRNTIRNTISFIRRDNGETTGDVQTIVDDFLKFYSGLFGKRVPRTPVDWSVMGAGYRLSSDDQKDLIRPVTVGDIKRALFDIGDDKAPGPDGYTSAFFKKNWDIVGHEVVASVDEFFSKGLILRRLNHTVVSLIPKTTHDPSVSDFRPIACTNVIYKIITKILTNRMAPLLQKLISPAQSAFIKGRSIMDNFFLAQELIRSYERKSGITARCMVKIDLKKAYDCISWDFLRDVLYGLNFHPCFIHWILTCVTSATFSITINGGSHGFIRGQRGLRQGDPMSPTLFLFCMEYLSRLLHARTHDSTFIHHPKCSSTDITHLAFADDLLLFGRGDPDSMRVIKDALDEFTETSGLTINKSKSHIFMGGVRPFEKQAILDLFGFPEGTLPVKYLGLPLASRSLTSPDYSPLLAQISSFIRRWSNSNLSRAGRLELIRSVLQGIECYWLQALPLPATIIDKITRMLRKFLWGNSHCPVAWKTVCLPRDEGGLGLRDLAVWNKALHSKTLWNIHAKTDSLWIKWIHAEFLRGQDIWEFPLPKRDAPHLSNILRIRDQLISDCTGDRTNAQALLVGWFTGKGTSSAYEHFRMKGDKKFWYKAVWRSFIPPKFSVTLWLAMHGRLKTFDRLKHSDIARGCVLCDCADESHDHLFFKCEKSVAVWTEICTWLRVRNQMTTIPSAVRRFQREKAGSGIIRKAKWIALGATVQFLWQARNLKYVENKPFDPSHIIKEIKLDVYRVLYSIFPAEAVMSHMDMNTS